MSFCNRSLGCFLLLLFGGSLLRAGETQNDEYSLKAIFLYRFANYVEWPPPVSRDFNLCILGSDPFGEALESIRGVKVGDRRISLRRAIALGEAKDCSIVFVGKSERHRLDKTLRYLGEGTLSVSDIDGFARQGGIINFIEVENKIRFEINPAAAERAGLKISSRLLRLARIVGPESTEGAK